MSKRVRFYNAVDLVNQLEREKTQGKVGNLAKQLCLVDAVIIVRITVKKAISYYFKKATNNYFKSQININVKTPLKA